MHDITKLIGLILIGLEGSIETILNGLKNPKGPGSIPIQSRGAKPQGIGLELDLGPRDFFNPFNIVSMDPHSN